MHGLKGVFASLGIADEKQATNIAGKNKPKITKFPR